MDQVLVGAMAQGGRYVYQGDSIWADTWNDNAATDVSLSRNHSHGEFLLAHLDAPALAIATSPAPVPAALNEPAPAAASFLAQTGNLHDDFMGGLNADWLVYEKQWGPNNNGCVPETISMVMDNVYGVVKPVVRIITQGRSPDNSGRVTGVKKAGREYVPSVDIPGLARTAAVGGCLVSKDSFASGEYTVIAKIGLTDDGRLPIGMCFSFWINHYEEHHEGNVHDPYYMPLMRQGSENDGFYSVINAEIDCPELGGLGNFQNGRYNTFLDDRDAFTFNQMINLPVNPAGDGEYHRYGLRWTNALQPLPPGPPPAMERVATGHFVATQGEFKGMRLTQVEGGWFRHVGQSVTYLFDEVVIGQVPVAAARLEVLPIAGNIVIGGWFPNWANRPGDAEASNWRTADVFVSEVIFVKYDNEGDVHGQPETFPLDGKVSWPLPPPPPPPAV